MFAPKRLVAGILAALTIALLASAVALGAIAAQLTQTAASISSDPFRDAPAQALLDEIARATRKQGTAATTAAPVLTGLGAQLARGERVNLLLLGYGGEGHSGAFLTDSLMLVSLEPRSGSAAMLSLPRDLVVRIPADRYAGERWDKVNAAFAPGAAAGDRDAGMRAAQRAIESAVGVRIDRVVAVDFRAFRTVVDAVGGIDLEVERAFSAQYPRSDTDEGQGWMTVAFPAGAQHMDGETALRYARARYSDGPEGSDFARAARQQKVIVAAKNKALAANSVPGLLGLLGALKDNVRTDLSLADLQALATLARGYDDTRTRKDTLSTANVLTSGTFIVAGSARYALVPATDWGAVHAYSRSALGYTGGETEPAAPPLVRFAAPAPASTPGPETPPVSTQTPLPSATTPPMASAPSASPSSQPTGSPPASALPTATPSGAPSAPVPTSTPTSAPTPPPLPTVNGMLR